MVRSKVLSVMAIIPAHNSHKAGQDMGCNTCGRGLRTRLNLNNKPWQEWLHQCHQGIRAIKTSKE